ncbi:hypothetical protein JG688_00000778 [Phytophthora aleatoria]|uniref:Uncharacterized protein n=1 Tax=Phytophthora aleatoria TaxID=2496075 RepID=A0A8J5J7D9_9STRA|nr:hypothetical protein JG688_00000778 [Phytophthora aleatoria]
MRKHQLARTSCSRNRILRLEKRLAAAPHDYPIPVAGEISCLLNTNAVVLTSTVNYDMNTNSCKSAYVTTAVGNACSSALTYKDYVVVVEREIQCRTVLRCRGAVWYHDVLGGR